MTVLSYKKALLAPALLLGMLASQSVSAEAGFRLSAPVWTNAQVQFTLIGVSAFTCIIEHSSDLQTWTPVLTNTDAADTRLLAADAPNDVGFFRARLGPFPLFSAAIAALGNIDLKGNDVTTDSFDSGDTNYSNGGLYPFGDLTRTKANGDVCTDAVLVDSLYVGNADIKGHVRTGPGTNTIAIGANGTVGDRAWVEGGNTGIQPGWSSTDVNLIFPDVLLPSTTWLPAPGTGTVAGVTYSNVFDFSGDYNIGTLGGKIYVGTNVSVRLKVSGSATFNSTNAIRISPGGTLTIYMLGSTFNLYAAASVDNQSHHPDSFVLLGLPSCTTVNLSTIGEFDGCVYAPEASLTMGGGGSTSLHFVGAAVARTVSINGHVSFHYDENLRRTGPFH